VSAFTEFILIAVVLYLWESTLWLPQRGIALRRKWFKKGWKVHDPRSLITGRELGMIPMLPLPSDTGLAPCQAPPLIACQHGRFLMESSEGFIKIINSLEWSDLSEKDHHFSAKALQTRITSPRANDFLRRAKERKVTLEVAVRRLWELAISPERAGREWARWRRVAAPLRLYCPVLMLGTFAGLPLAYLYLETLQILVLAAWLWLLMAIIAGHLWWLGKRVYPGAKAALRMDAVLCLFVPFHAMRALEIASVHALGATHPLGLLLWARDWKNPWLGQFTRRVIYPLPGSDEELLFSEAVKIPLTVALNRCGKTLEEFDHAPSRGRDTDSSHYCPRCHALYLAHVSHCPDCRELELVKL
jgi:hypothetical protein